MQAARASPGGIERGAARPPRAVYDACVLARALDMVGSHCDLEQRARDIPPGARARGIWVRTYENALDRKGRLRSYLDVFGGRAPSLGWLALDEVVARLAVAGALYTSPAELQLGIRSIAREQPVLFAESLLGKTMFRLLSSDPVRVLQQGAAARRQTCNYGRWEHDFSHPNRAIVHHYEEYAWLESQTLGGAEGTFRAIGVEATFRLELRGPYEGVIDITW